MVQFENGFLEVELAMKSTAVLLTWKGYVPSLQYREGMEKSLDIARKNNIRNWISDIRHLHGIDTKDQEWVGREWLPAAVSTDCYKYQAVIVANDPFAEPSALNMITNVQDQSIEIQHFTNLKEAKQWLKHRE